MFLQTQSSVVTGPATHTSVGGQYYFALWHLSSSVTFHGVAYSAGGGPVEFRLVRRHFVIPVAAGRPCHRIMFGKVVNIRCMSATLTDALARRHDVLNYLKRQSHHRATNCSIVSATTRHAEGPRVVS